MHGFQFPADVCFLLWAVCGGLALGRSEPKIHAQKWGRHGKTENMFFEQTDYMETRGFVHVSSTLPPLKPWFSHLLQLASIP